MEMVAGLADPLSIPFSHCWQPAADTLSSPSICTRLIRLPGAAGCG